MIHYNKLVRDNVPDTMARQNKQIVYHSATTDKEYWFKLREKLQEELHEFDDRGDIESLADIFEVLEAMAKARNMDLKEVMAVKENKQIEKGSFDKRIILEQSPEEMGDRQFDIL
jgi:predicted house-cleaning noncanonical NTP pyrophosphatase (MazG superfamily)